MFLVCGLLLPAAFRCAVFVFERHVREPCTLAIAGGRILLSWYTLSSEFVVCNSQCANKRERRGQKNKKEVGGVRLESWGEKMQFVFV